MRAFLDFVQQICGGETCGLTANSRTLSFLLIARIGNSCRAASASFYDNSIHIWKVAAEDASQKVNAPACVF